MSDLPIFPNGLKPDEFCFPCGLYKQCKHPRMQGEGNEHPEILFVGEAPGAEEDENGFPFCGPSGEELRQSIEDVGIDISKCRFTNSVRCRPLNNDLKKFPDAIEHCRPHILREIRSTRPRVVVLIGNSAIKSVLNRTGILKLHNEVIDAGWVKYVCMFHPSYLLRSNTPTNRRKFLEALKTAKFVANPKFQKASEKRNRIVIKDKKMLQEYVDILKKEKYKATDIESSGLSPFSKLHKPEISVIGFSWTKYDGVAFPIHRRIGLTDCKVRPEEMLEGVREIYEDENSRFLTWNGKFDLCYTLATEDIWMGGRNSPTGFYWDGMLGSYSLDEKPGVHGLDDWAARLGMPGYYLPLKQYHLLNPKTDPEKGGNMNLVPAEILYPYNIDDCICTYRGFQKQMPMLKKQGLWERPFKFPLRQISWIAGMMELAGLNVDLKKNTELNEKFLNYIDKLESKMRQDLAVKELQHKEDIKTLRKLFERVRAYKRPVPNVKKKVFELFKSEPVNLNSPEKKRTLVYDILGLDHYYKTKKTEEGSTERWVLEEIAQTNRVPLLKTMIKSSMYSTIHSKVINPIPNWIGTDGRVHPNMLAHGTRTGRLSCKDPNLYNLPARHPLTPILMEQFIAGKNRLVVKQDSKQIELRLIADRAKDKVMIQEFEDGKDPHMMGAQAAYEISEKKWAMLPKEKQKEYRSHAKNAVSFGLVYGREARALAGDFGWGLKKAEEFKERYFAKYHGIADYLAERAEYILEHGEVISLYGNRHRRLPDVHSENEGVRNAAIREGINAPIQADASDCNIMAAYRMARWIKENDLKTKVILYVYDAVYLDAYYKELKLVIQKLHHFMTDREYIKDRTGWNLGVPLDTDCSVGYNFGQMIELNRVDGVFQIPKQFLEARVS